MNDRLQAQAGKPPTSDDPSGGSISPHSGRAARVPLSISQLRAEIAGRVIAPDDGEYDAARTIFIGGVDRRPAVIVRAADATDVSRVVLLARETRLELSVRSGGHSGAGHGVSEGGIVLDLSAMRGLEIGSLQMRLQDRGW